MFMPTMFALTAILFCYNYLGFRRMLGYGLYLDLAVTYVLATVTIGTFGGIWMGVVGGGIFSAFMTVARRTFKAEKYKVRVVFDGWKPRLWHGWVRQDRQKWT